MSVLIANGSPYEMGVAHGRTLRVEIHKFVDIYLKRSKVHFDVPYEYLQACNRTLFGQLPSCYREEMQGVSDGAQVSLDDIALCNSLADIDALYMRRSHQCCNFVASSLHTVNNGFLHGRNLDFPPGGGILPQTSVVVCRKPAEKRKRTTWSIAWAGYVGAYTIANDSGISIAEIGVPAPDVSLDGVPMAILLRRAAELCETCDEVYELFRCSPRTGGFNVAVADAKTGEAYAIELTRTRIARRRMREGRLIVDDVCFCRETSRNRLTYPAGTFRYARMVQLFEQHRGKIDEQVALSMLRDNHDCSTGKPGKGYNCICNRHTVQSVLFNLAEGRILVSHSSVPAPLGEYQVIETGPLVRSSP